MENALFLFIVVCVFVLGLLLGADVIRNGVSKQQVVYVNDVGFQCKKVSP